MSVNVGRAQLAKLVEAAAGDSVNVLLHRQFRVQRHTQVTNTVQRDDVDSSYRQSDVFDLLQLLRGAEPDELCFVGVQL